MNGFLDLYPHFSKNILGLSDGESAVLRGKGIFPAYTLIFKRKFSHEFHRFFSLPDPTAAVAGHPSATLNTPALSVHGLLMLNLFDGIGATMCRKLFVAPQRESFPSSYREIHR
jgi:hypothetical protein